MKECLECLFHAWLQESPPPWNFELDDHVKLAKCGGFTVDFEPFLESRSGIIEYCPSQRGWIVRIMLFFMFFLLFEALQILHSGVAAQLSGCGNQDIDSMTCQLHVTLLMWALWASPWVFQVQSDQVSMSIMSIMSMWSGAHQMWSATWRRCRPNCCIVQPNGFCFARCEQWIWMENHDMCRTGRSYDKVAHQHPPTVLSERHGKRRQNVVISVATSRDAGRPLLCPQLPKRPTTCPLVQLLAAETTETNSAKLCKCCKCSKCSLKHFQLCW